MHSEQQTRSLPMVNSNRPARLVEIGLAALVATFASAGLASGAITFQPPGAVVPGAQSPVYGDFNGDGVRDLVYQVGSSIGGGASPAAGSNASASFGLVAGDFNGDGSQDLVSWEASDFGGTQGWLMLGDGQGRVGSKLFFPIPEFVSGVAGGDLNGDGRGDLVVTQGRVSFGGGPGSGGGVNVLYGQATGTFSSPIDVAPDLYTTFNPVVGEFTGDGRVDAAVAAQPCQGCSSRAFLLANSGSGGLSAAGQIGSSAVSGVSAGGVRSGGGRDLILVNSGDAAAGDVGGVSVRSPNGTLTDLTAVPDYPTAAGGGDLDGDGFADILIAARGSGDLAAFAGSASGYEQAGTTAASTDGGDVFGPILFRDASGGPVAVGASGGIATVVGNPSQPPPAEGGPVIFIPGTLGTYLARDNGAGDERWVQACAVYHNKGDGADLNPDVLGDLTIAANGEDDLNPTARIGVATNRGWQGVIRQAGCNFSDEEAYAPILDRLVAAGYVYRVNPLLPPPGSPSQTLFPLGTDWRRSAAWNAKNRLLPLIDRALEGRPAGTRVTILAHSQGGLTVNALLSQGTCGQVGSCTAVLGKIGRVVTFGTPYLGAPKATSQLAFHYPCQQYADPTVPSPGFGRSCWVDQGTVQNLVADASGLLELIAQPNYYRLAQAQPVFGLRQTFAPAYNHQYRSYTESINPTTGFLGPTLGRFTDFRRSSPTYKGPRAFNLPMIQQAADLHAAMDLWNPIDPTVQLLRVVGTGKPTAIVARRTRFKKIGPFGIPRVATNVRLRFGTGDGTVPLNSAALFNVRRDLGRPSSQIPQGEDLRGTGKNLYVPCTEHLDLTQDETVFALVLDYVRNGTAPAGDPPASIATCRARTTARVAAAAAGPVPALDSGPVALSGTQLLAGGEFDGTITDTRGGVLRAEIPDEDDGPISSNLRGGTFVGGSGDELGSFWTQEDDTYSANLTARSEADAVLTLASWSDDQVATLRSTSTVHLPKNARVTFTYTQPLSTTGQITANIDDNADGLIDRTEAFGPAVTGAGTDDEEPPATTTTTAPFIATDGTRRIRVALNATDTGGAGVASIAVTRQPGNLTTAYTAPLDLPANGTLYVRATDRAGNVESAQRIQLDDWPDLRDEIETPSTGTISQTGTVATTADVDWFAVTVDTGQQTFNLTPATFPLAVYDTDGNPIAEANPGTPNQGPITRQLPAGTYYVRVGTPTGANTPSTTPYTLTVRRDTTAPTAAITRPSQGQAFTVGQVVTSEYACADEAGGSGVATCAGTVPSGAAIDTATSGAKTFTVTSTDRAGNATTRAVTYNVTSGAFPFTGFLQPVDNRPVVNTVNAGRAIPVKFKLGGNRGLGVMASGYPQAQVISCATGAPTSEIEQTVTAGSSSLTYDPATDTYTYTWKTDTAWAGTCRRFIMILTDNTTHDADFRFR